MTILLLSFGSVHAYDDSSDHGDRNDRYMVRVPVSSLSSDARNEAAKVGLQRVLQRLTNNADWLTQSDIKQELRRASYYVQDFRYEDTSIEEYQYYLHLTFSQVDVDRMIKKYQIPLAKQGPATLLLWLKVQPVNASPYWVSDTDLREEFPFLRELADSMTFSIVLPLLDMQELSVLESISNMNKLKPYLGRLSERYQHQWTLYGDVVQHGTEWQASLILQHGLRDVLTIAEMHTDVNQLFANVFEKVNLMIQAKALTPRNPPAKKVVSEASATPSPVVAISTPPILNENTPHARVV